MKKGDKVICIDDSCVNHIKKGKIYTINKVTLNGAYVGLIGKFTSYRSERFELVEETTEEYEIF
jgi:hypothetical protein